MKLSAIVDFYLLERLFYEANYTNVPVDNGESYDVKRESVRTRINIEYHRLAKELAESFRDYLWVAAFGEARHAWGKIDGSARISRDIPRDPYGGRDSAMRHATEFSPNNEQNYTLLRGVYMDCHWCGSAFGGNAWGKIVEACKLYEKWPHAVFVDYCCDLQHNTGTVFSKWGAQDFIDLQFTRDHDFFISMEVFLNTKKHADNICFDLPRFMGIWVSRSVRNLIREWYSLTPAWVHATQTTVDFHSYRSTAWGNRVMSDDLVTPNQIHSERYSQEHKQENPVSEAQRTRRLEEGQIHCQYCGRVVWSDETYNLRKQGLVCRACFHRFMVRCESCNRYTLKEDAHDVGDSYHYYWVCWDCYCENYTECNSCGEVFHHEDTYYSEVTEYDYCESCYHDLFSDCEECGEEGLKDDMHNTSDGWYCDDCYRDTFPECPSCQEHDEDGEFTEHYCKICGQVESWCDDCLHDDKGVWIKITGHRLARELPALYTVSRKQLSLGLALA